MKIRPCCPFPDDTCRYPYYNGKRWNVSGNYSPCPNYTTITDSYPGQYDGACRNQAVRTYDHVSARAKKSQLVGFNLPNLRWNWVKRHVRGEKILDIGFAHQSSEIPRDKSYHSMIAAQNKGSLVVGLDIDSEVVHEVKQRYPVECAIVADATFLPFRDNSFDTVFMGDVIEHVWEPLLLLQEVYRLMKVQGRLFLTTPNLLDFARVLRYMVRGVIGGLNEEPGHCRFYDKVSLNRLLEHAGFIVIYCEAWKFRVPFFGRYLKFNLHTPPFSNCGLHLFVSAIKTSIHRSYEYML